MSRTPARKGRRGAGRRFSLRALRPAAVTLGAAILGVWIVSLRTPPRPEAGAPPGAIRVVTYNIRAALGGLDGIASDLSPWQADVIGLQEVERGIPRSRSADQPGDLAATLGMQAEFAGSFAVGSGEHGIAILSRHPMSDVRVLELPRGSGRWPRVALCARIEAPAAPFRFVVVHLARPWSWPFSNTATRLAQLDALLGELENEELPVVLAGDFNSFPISFEALSTSRRLATSWRPWRDGWATSFPLEAIGLPGGSVKIDHVYHERSWRSLGHWVAPLGASDHRAVIVDLLPRSGAGDRAR